MSTDITFQPGREIGYRPTSGAKWQLAKVIAVVEGHLHISTSDPKGLTVLRMSDPDFWDHIGTPF